MKKLNIVGDLRDLILIFQIVLWEKFFFQKLKFISNVRLINVFSSFWCLIFPWMMMSAKFLLGVLCNDWCLKIDQKCTDCPNLIKQTSLINRKYILQDFECLDSAYCLLNMYSHICDFLSLFYLIFCKLTLVIKESRYIQVHPRGSRRSFITKPLSAITLSPLSSNERIPDCLVISLSDMPPVYNWDTKVTLPEGAIYTQQCFSCSGTFVLWENLRLPQQRGRCLDLEFSGIRDHPCWRKFPTAIGHCFLNYMFRQPEIDRSQHKIKQIDPWCKYPWNCGTRNVE